MEKTVSETTQRKFILKEIKKCWRMQGDCRLFQQRLLPCTGFTLFWRVQEYPNLFISQFFPCSTPFHLHTVCMERCTLLKVLPALTPFLLPQPPMATIFLATISGFSKKVIAVPLTIYCHNLLINLNS